MRLEAFRELVAEPDNLSATFRLESPVTPDAKLNAFTRILAFRDSLTRRADPENICPACGPVPAEATSRYCDRHIRKLKAAWLSTFSDQIRSAA